jgi:predicted nucleic acid-binding protein
VERFLFDSSAILEVLAGTAKGRKCAEIAGGSEVCTSAICYCEVLNKVDAKHARVAEAFLSKLALFGVSLSDAFTAVKMQGSCRARGKFVPTVDCLIAATARNNKAIVVTADKDFERIEEIALRIL